MTAPTPEWKTRTAFAEMAEAIGVPTDMIMGIYGQPADAVIVIYTPAWDEQNWEQIPVLWVQLKRDARGVFQKGEPMQVGTAADFVPPPDWRP